MFPCLWHMCYKFSSCSSHNFCLWHQIESYTTALTAQSISLGLNWSSTPSCQPQTIGLSPRTNEMEAALRSQLFRDQTRKLISCLLTKSKSSWYQSNLCFQRQLWRSRRRLLTIKTLFSRSWRSSFLTTQVPPCQALPHQSWTFNLRLACKTWGCLRSLFSQGTLLFQFFRYFRHLEFFSF